MKLRRFITKNERAKMSGLTAKISAIGGVFFVFLFLAAAISARETPKIAVLRIGDTGVKFYGKFRAGLAEQKSLSLVDDDLSRAALLALKYENAFNLSLEEAKNLGAAIDCRFYLLVKSDTLRRSSFKKDVYFESHAGIFLVSARTGRLGAWEIIAEEADAPEQSEKQLLREIEKISARFATKIQVVEAVEREERAAALKRNKFFEISDQAAAETENIRTPLPYRSLKPPYADVAARWQIEAAVEIAVEINVEGIVENAEIRRWAGYGLDEAVTETVRKMQFRPALQNGAPIPARFLLRYNFRRSRPAKE